MKQKLLVQALSNIMLVDPSTGDYIDSKRPHVVNNTYFIKQRSGGTVPPMTPQIKVFDVELKDDATDAELAKFFKDSDGDEHLAMNAFLSKWHAEAPDTTEEAQAKAEKEEAERVAKEEADRIAAAATPAGQEGTENAGQEGTENATSTETGTETQANGQQAAEGQETSQGAASTETPADTKVDEQKTAQAQETAKTGRRRA